MVEPSTRCHSSISPSSRMKKPTARTTSDTGERPTAASRRQRTRQSARASASRTTWTNSTGASSATSQATKARFRARQAARVATMITVTRTACTKSEGPRRAGRGGAELGVGSDSGGLTRAWRYLTMQRWLKEPTEEAGTEPATGAAHRPTDRGRHRVQPAARVAQSRESGGGAGGGRGRGQPAARVPASRPFPGRALPQQAAALLLEYRPRGRAGRADRESG